MLDATPDSEDFGTPAASSALSAALLAVAITEFIDDREDSHVLDAIGYALESVDAKAIGELEAPVVDLAVDSYVSSHPLVERERRAEESDVIFLTELPEAPWPSSMLSMLHARAVNQSTLLGSE